MRARACVLLLATAVVVPAEARDRGATGDRFAAADADGNGVLSREEMQRSSPRLAADFDRVDRNRDGSVSRDELAAFLQAAKSRSRAPGEGGFAEHFRRADTDGDGGLTRAECERSLPRLAIKFERIDRDRDGRLTLDELKAWFDERRVARGKPAAGS